MCSAAVTSEPQLLSRLGIERPVSQASGQPGSAAYGAPMVGSNTPLGPTYIAQHVRPLQYSVRYVSASADCACDLRRTSYCYSFVVSHVLLAEE